MQAGLISESTAPSKSQEVVILLATANGARYLGEQLESILSQTLHGWRIIAADDGSSDTTLEILHTFRESHPGRLTILDEPPVHSAKDNFFRLLLRAPRAAYYAFCDQDDVWHPDKLATLVDACRRLEDAAPTSTPCLVYSDLVVVDEDLEVTADSFMSQIAVTPSRTTLGSLLVENSVPGCATLFNDPLRTIFAAQSGPFDDVFMHDWWLALIAKALGRLEFVDRPLVSYRQHGRNSLGSVNRRGLVFMINKLRNSSTGTDQALRQGHLFSQIYAPSAPPDTARTLAAFTSLNGKSRVRRAAICIRHGILKQTFARRVYQMMRG